MIDYVMIALIWLFILSAVIAAAGVPTAAWLLLQKREKRRWVLSFAVCLVLVVVILARLCQQPVLTYAADCKTELSIAQKNVVMSVSEGFYSGVLPLVPVKVTVTDVAEENIRWIIRYFPFGTVGMEHGGDGYSIIKPLN